MKKIRYYIFRFGFVFLFVMIFTSCGTKKSNFNGKYVNTKDAFNDYYIFDDDDLKYLHYQNGTKSSGTYFFRQELMYIINDSIKYYNNIGLPVKIRESKSIDSSFVYFEKGSYKKFNELFPEVKLYFVGYPYSIEKNKTLIVVPINSSKNSFTIENYENMPEHFRIIGLNYSCGVYYDSESCKIFEKSFQSKLYKLENYAWSVNINIDLSPLLSKGLKAIKKIEVTDSIASAKKFVINGIYYEKD